MKTYQLSGAALDWAVAKCEGHEIDSLMGGAVWYWRKCSLTGEPEVVEVFRPSTDWAQGGPIVERGDISFRKYHNEKSKAHGRYYARLCRESGTMVCWGKTTGCQQTGPTPLIAAMRCYVASKLGTEIDIPEELV